MSMFNFWIMDFAVSGLTLLSAFYGDQRRREGQSSAPNKSEKNIAKKEVSPENTPPPFVKELKEIIDVKPTNISSYLVFNFTYFAIMTLTVFLLQYYTTLIIGLQHLAIVGFLLFAFTQWIRGKAGYIAGSLFIILWIVSASTNFRWLINNIIIAMFAVLASHVQFRNFAFLQIFLWTAFIYDVFLLSKMSSEPQLFSITGCSSLLCKLFEVNDAWQLPAVFTVRFGDTSTHVFLGTGDIVIGALISNFALSFFKSFKCLLLTVSSYGLAIGLLSCVDDNRPFPALFSIVPCCSLALVFCAVCCRKTKRLFSLKQRDFDYTDDDLVVI